MRAARAVGRGGARRSFAALSACKDIGDVSKVIRSMIVSEAAARAFHALKMLNVTRFPSSVPARK
jgi:hypothetical protein